jgi:hypothetical protein
MRRLGWLTWSLAVALGLADLALLIMSRVTPIPRKALATTDAIYGCMLATGALIAPLLGLLDQAGVVGVAPSLGLWLLAWRCWA